MCRFFFFFFLANIGFTDSSSEILGCALLHGIRITNIYDIRHLELGLIGIHIYISGS